MRAPYLHPEFGYFCPTPGLRRMVKVALAFTVIGALAGAGGMTALIADHDSNLDGVAMTAHGDMHGAEQQPGASAPALVKAEATPKQADAAKPAAKTERIKLDIGKSDVAKSEAAKVEMAKSEATKSEATKSEATKSGATKSETTRSAAAKSETGTVSAKVEPTRVDVTAVEAAKPEAAKVDTTKPDAAKAAAAATVCEANSWTSLDGTCGSGQVRKMRIVRVPTANRTSAAATGANRPVAAAVSASSQSKPTQGVAATAARAQEPAQQAVAAAKKPQKVAGQNRRRDQAAGHVSPPRPEAVSPLASGPFGGFFGVFR
jgi:hypothetical protein